MRLEPKVSVIVTLYKNEKQLMNCLQSLAHQTYKNLELIFVIDASPENDEQLVRDFFKQRKEDVKIIVHNENMRMGISRNDGFAKATGDFIHFFDGDDYCALDFYEKFVNAINKAPDADVFICDSISYKWDDRTYCKHLNTFSIVNTNFVVATLEEKMKLTALINNEAVWRCLYKKDFLVNNNLKFEEGYAEDVKFLTQVLLKCNMIVSVPDAFYFYYSNPNGILATTYGTPESKLAYADAREKRKKLYTAQGMTPEVFASICARKEEKRKHHSFWWHLRRMKF
jgi:glycosyltransferase involved in cell wall biosynthesis